MSARLQSVQTSRQKAALPSAVKADGPLPSPRRVLVGFFIRDAPSQLPPASLRYEACCDSCTSSSCEGGREPSFYKEADEYQSLN